MEDLENNREHHPCWELVVGETEREVEILACHFRVEENGEKQSEEERHHY